MRGVQNKTNTKCKQKHIHRDTGICVRICMSVCAGSCMYFLALCSERPRSKIPSNSTEHTWPQILASRHQSPIKWICLLWKNGLIPWLLPTGKTWNVPRNCGIRKWISTHKITDALYKGHSRQICNCSQKQKLEWSEQQSIMFYLLATAMESNHFFKEGRFILLEIGV